MLAGYVGMAFSESYQYMVAAQSLYWQSDVNVLDDGRYQKNKLVFLLGAYACRLANTAVALSVDGYFISPFTLSRFNEFRRLLQRKGRFSQVVRLIPTRFSVNNTCIALHYSSILKLIICGLNSHIFVVIYQKYTECGY